MRARRKETHLVEVSRVAAVVWLLGVAHREGTQAVGIPIRQRVGALHFVYAPRGCSFQMEFGGGSGWHTAKGKCGPPPPP
jgi:hypothetical protein